MKLKNTLNSKKTPVNKKKLYSKRKSNWKKNHLFLKDKFPKVHYFLKRNTQLCKFFVHIFALPLKNFPLNFRKLHPLIQSEKRYPPKFDHCVFYRVFARFVRKWNTLYYFFLPNYHHILLCCNIKNECQFFSKLSLSSLISTQSPESDLFWNKISKLLSFF